MIVDTSTGEVLTTRRTYHVARNYNSYHHVHTYKPSGITVASRVLGVARNVGGRVRRNSFSIFAIFAIILFYCSLIAKVTNPSASSQLTFTGFLDYFSRLGQRIEASSLVDYFRTYQSGTSLWLRLANFRFDGVLEVFNPLLIIISPSFKIIGTAFSILAFIGECIVLLFEFLLAIFSFLFSGLFM